MACSMQLKPLHCELHPLGVPSKLEQAVSAPSESVEMSVRSVSFTTRVTKIMQLNNVT